MDTLEDIFRFIDALPLEEFEQNDIKFVIIAQKYDRLAEHFTTHQDQERIQRDLELIRKDIEHLQTKMTVRIGVMVAAGVGILATLMKLL